MKLIDCAGYGGTIEECVDYADYSLDLITYYYGPDCNAAFLSYFDCIGQLPGCDASSCVDEYYAVLEICSP